MKSMKLASGFAISALAMAIAGAATAQTTTEVNYTGSVKAQTTFDLENDTRANTLPGSTPGSATEDWFHLESQLTVSNGPFSGNINIGVEADDDAHGGTANVRVEDLIVEEGPVSFGQIGGVTATADLLEELTDFDFAGKTALKFGVDGGARYTVEELGLQVQAEGAVDSGVSDDFGLAAGIEQDLDVATVWADVQYRETTGGVSDGETAFGVGVEASPVDMVTVKGVFRTKSDENAGDGQSAFGVRADVSVSDTLSVYGQVANNDTDADDNMAFRVGSTATFAPITVEGSYAANTADVALGNLDAKVSYAEGPIDAFAETEVQLRDDANGVKFVLGGGYTTDSGIKYGAEYENRNDDHSKGVASEVRAFAQYSF